MIGAIIGDIVGSVYEWNNIKTKAFPLFQDKCFFTDDTVMTIAVAEGLMNGGEKDDFIDAMKKYGRMYPNAGYGGRFRSWLFSESREPYHSFGNGSAMRTAVVGWWFDSLEETWAMATLAAGVTHDHPEGIEGAESTAAAIFLARTGHSKAEIKAIKQSGDLATIPDGGSKKRTLIAAYMRQHPEVTNKSLIAREVGADRCTVRRYYDKIQRKTQQ